MLIISAFLLGASLIILTFLALGGLGWHGYVLAIMLSCSLAAGIAILFAALNDMKELIDRLIRIIERLRGTKESVDKLNRKEDK